MLNFYLFCLVLQIIPILTILTKSTKENRICGLISLKQNDELPIKSPENLQSSRKPNFDITAWQNGYSSCEIEVCKFIGTNLPRDIEGTYFKNGMAKFEVGNEKLLHPFDGDGMLSSIYIKNGKAFFQNRFIQTNAYKKELKTKSISYRGVFGTLKSNPLFNIFDLNFKNVANTNVLFWAKKLYALWEGGFPYEIIPSSLETIKESNLNGILKVMHRFGAHPKIDIKNNRMINYISSLGLSGTTLRMVEFDQNFKILSERSVQLPGITVTHDFAISENYYIIKVPKLKFSPFPLLLGLQGPAACTEHDVKLNGTIYLIPRNKPEQPIIKVVADGGFPLHYANAYEDSNGQVILDLIQSNSSLTGLVGHSSKVTNGIPIWLHENIFESIIPYSKIIRYTLTKADNIANSNAWQYQSTELSEIMTDFPTIHPKFVGRKNRFVYSNAGMDIHKSTPLCGLIKIDIKHHNSTSWYGNKYETLQEVTFVERNNNSNNLHGQEDDNEDNGYLIGYLFNGQLKRSDFVIFDAKNISKGPIYKIEIPTHIPYGLHGTFVSSFV
eukprot:gene11296-15154_t